MKTNQEVCVFKQKHISVDTCITGVYFSQGSETSSAKCKTKVQSARLSPSACVSLVLHNVLCFALG